MGETTIEWTNKTWNPVTGCNKVSPGCKNCYAERVFPRAYSNCNVCGHTRPEHNLPNSRCSQCPEGNRPECDGFVERKFTDVRCHPERLDQPLRWRKPARIFVNSMSDLFHEDVPDDFIKLVLRVVASCPQHTFQVLTKRPKRMMQFMQKSQNCDFFGDSWARRVRGQYGYSLQRIFQPIAEKWRANLWLGVSVESQQYADERIPLLLQTPAAVRFVSYEPALGPVDFTAKCPPHYAAHLRSDRISWVIAGSESGPHARPAELDWYRSVRDQCQAAGVAFFFKQHIVNGKKHSLPELDGKQWAEFPQIAK